MIAGALIDHLWQSTFAAAAIAILVLAFRRTPARTRYWIWLAASLKFLIPWAALTWLGARLAWRAALPSAPPAWTQVIEAVSLPFAAPPVDLVLPRAAGWGGVGLVAVAGAIWILGTIAILTAWFLRCRHISAAVRAGSPIESGRIRDAFDCLAPASALRLVYSDTSLEPGVFGIRRPVLFWPRDIERARRGGRTRRRIRRTTDRTSQGAALISVRSLSAGWHSIFFGARRAP